MTAAFVNDNISPTPPTYGIPPDLVIDDMVMMAAPANLWHLPTAIWEKVWSRVTGNGIKIAVLDTGYKDHPDLPTPIAMKSFVGGQSATDGHGHGTHCCGTALGRNGLGVARDAQLIVGKVLSNGGSGSSSGIADGVRWAVDQGADVISMSLGGGSSYGPTNTAIDYAWSKGCIVNAAAGNDGYRGGNTVGWPAKYANCVCCGSYQESGAISNFSSGGNELDWACPGSNIVSCSLNGGYRSMSGTSMATPFGSGVLALITELLRREGASRFQAANELRNFLAAVCQDKGDPGKDVRFGVGIPVASKIIEALANDDISWL